MDQYYFNGTIYQNKEDWYKAINYFNSTPLNDKSLDSLGIEFLDNLRLNLLMKPLEDRITNEAFRLILDDALCAIIEHAEEIFHERDPLFSNNQSDIADETKTHENQVMTNETFI